MKKRPRPMFLTFLLGVAIFYLASMALVYTQQAKFIFPAAYGLRINKIEATPLAPHVETVTTPDGTELSGVVFESQTENAPLVLTFGGNAHDVTGFAYFLHHTVYEQKAHVVGFAYRGYPHANGHSAGKPTQDRVFADATHLYDIFTERFDANAVLTVGYSLGTSVAIHVAAERAVDGVGLIAPFSSITSVAQQNYWFYPVEQLLKYPFDSRQMLENVTAPILILAAEQDGVLPDNEAKKLASANPKATVIALGDTDHVSVINDSSVPMHLRRLIN